MLSKYCNNRTRFTYCIYATLWHIETPHPATPRAYARCAATAAAPRRPLVPLAASPCFNTYTPYCKGALNPSVNANRTFHVQIRALQNESTFFVYQFDVIKHIIDKKSLSGIYFLRTLARHRRIPS